MTPDSSTEGKDVSSVLDPACVLRNIACLSVDDFIQKRPGRSRDAYKLVSDKQIGHENCSYIGTILGQQSPFVLEASNL